MEGKTGFQGPDTAATASRPTLGRSGTSHQVPFSVRQDHDSLRLVGEVDLATCHTLVEALDAGIRQLDGNVILDCSAITFFGAAGVDALVQAHNQLDHSQRRLVVRNPSAIVRRILDIVGVAELFAETPDAAA